MTYHRSACSTFSPQELESFREILDAAYAELLGRDPFFGDAALAQVMRTQLAAAIISFARSGERDPRQLQREAVRCVGEIRLESPRRMALRAS